MHKMYVKETRWILCRFVLNTLFLSKSRISRGLHSALLRSIISLMYSQNKNTCKYLSFVANDCSNRILQRWTVWEIVSKQTVWHLSTEVSACDLVWERNIIKRANETWIFVPNGKYPTFIKINSHLLFIHSFCNSKRILI